LHLQRIAELLPIEVAKIGSLQGPVKMIS